MADGFGGIWEVGRYVDFCTILSLTHLLAGLVFTKEVEREWLDRRFGMLEDILRDSWVYQKIKQEGLLEGREEALQGERLTLLEIVQTKFPALESQVRKKADATNDLATLRHLIVQVSLAQTEESAKQVLLIKKARKRIYHHNNHHFDFFCRGAMLVI